MEDHFSYAAIEAQNRRRRNATLVAIQSSMDNLANNAALLDAPSLLMQAVIVPGEKTKEGVLIAAVAEPWFEIMEFLKGDPMRIHELDWRKLEEIVAAAWKRAGFEVVLTPRSNDRGRDVIATRHDCGTIRIFDQVKKYAPHNLVDADEVYKMKGILDAYGNVSKGFITTTSGFAPGIYSNEELLRYIPARIELKGGKDLLDWLSALAKKA